jgi:TfoX/Sxy family transcriptional regulator of competence genes
MAYDETLAERLRTVLKAHANVSEKKMFGGVAFLLDGKMFVGVVKDELMVRVGPDAHASAVAQPYARIMDFTGRPMVGFVFVAPKGFATDKALGEWAQRGYDFVATIEAKAPKRKLSVKTPTKSAARATAATPAPRAKRKAVASKKSAKAGTAKK